MERRIKWLQLAVLAVLVLGIQGEEEKEAEKSRKLDQQAPDFSIMCGGCPCDNPCYPPPPPPPPVPCPPPPMPPPPPKPIKYCPPPPPACGGCWLPPSAPYIIINGPPGDLYQTTSYSGHRISTGSPTLMLLLGLAAIW